MGRSSSIGIRRGKGRLRIWREGDLALYPGMGGVLGSSSFVVDIVRSLSRCFVIWVACIDARMGGDSSGDLPL